MGRTGFERDGRGATAVVTAEVETVTADVATPADLDRVASLLAFASAMPPDPLPYRATYAGTKRYVVTFTRTLAAEDVVAASLVGLAHGELVCVPGLADPAALEQLTEVEALVRSAGRSTGMAARYRSRRIGPVGVSSGRPPCP